MRTIPDAPDHDPIPTEAEVEHMRLVATPSSTAAGIAQSMVRVAYSDLAKAYHQIAQRNNEEAIAILAEARDELEAAQNMISGRVWSLAL